MFKIGYPVNKKNLKFIAMAFQRRFRQSLINGMIDRECLDISTNLLKNLR